MLLTWWMLLHSRTENPISLNINTSVASLQISAILFSEPFTEYKIWVKAFTKKNDGLPSDPVMNTTDVAGPSEPRLLNLTCKTQETIKIEWERPAQIYNTLDYYYIYIDGEDVINDNITIPASRNLTNTVGVSLSSELTHYLSISLQYILPNVTTNAQYVVQVAASSKSLYSEDLIMGRLSEPKMIHMFPNCDKIQEYMRHTTDEISAGMVAGIICAGFAFLLSISAFVLWRLV